MMALPPLIMDRSQNDVSLVKMGKDCNQHISRVQRDELLNSKQQKSPRNSFNLLEGRGSW